MFGRTLRIQRSGQGPSVWYTAPRKTFAETFSSVVMGMARASVGCVMARVSFVPYCKFQSLGPEIGPRRSGSLFPSSAAKSAGHLDWHDVRNSYPGPNAQRSKQGSAAMAEMASEGIITVYRYELYQILRTLDNPQHASPTQQPCFGCKPTRCCLQ